MSVMTIFYEHTISYLKNSSSALWSAFGGLLPRIEMLTINDSRTGGIKSDLK
jgi:hypothetical protein